MQTSAPAAVNTVVSISHLALSSHPIPHWGMCLVTGALIWVWRKL